MKVNALGAGHACHIKPLVWIYGDDIEAPPCVYEGDIGAPFAAQTRKMRGKGGGGGKPGLEWASPQGLFQMDARAPPTFNLDARACRVHSIRPPAPLTKMLMHMRGILKHKPSRRGGVQTPAPTSRASVGANHLKPTMPPPPPHKTRVHLSSRQGLSSRRGSPERAPGST